MELLFVHFRLRIEALRQAAQSSALYVNSIIPILILMHIERKIFQSNFQN